MLENIYKTDPLLVDMKPLLEIEKEKELVQVKKEEVFGKHLTDKAFFEKAGIQGILDKASDYRNQ